jgi:hypothetical protein
MSQMFDVAPGDVLEFDYVNYRGERAQRRCTVLSLAYGRNDHHPDVDQWFIVGDDPSRDNVRHFAMKDMTNVRKM